MYIFGDVLFRKTFILFRHSFMFHCRKMHSNTFLFLVPYMYFIFFFSCCHGSAVSHFGLSSPHIALHSIYIIMGSVECIFYVRCRFGSSSDGSPRGFCGCVDKIHFHTPDNHIKTNIHRPMCIQITLSQCHYTHIHTHMHTSPPGHSRNRSARDRPHLAHETSQATKFMIIQFWKIQRIYSFVRGLYNVPACIVYVSWWGQRK